MEIFTRINPRLIETQTILFEDFTRKGGGGGKYLNGKFRLLSLILHVKKSCNLFFRPGLLIKISCRNQWGNTCMVFSIVLRFPRRREWTGTHTHTRTHTYIHTPGIKRLSDRSRIDRPGECFLRNWTRRWNWINVYRDVRADCWDGLVGSLGPIVCVGYYLITLEHKSQRHKATSKTTLGIGVS